MVLVYLRHSAPQVAVGEIREARNERCCNLLEQSVVLLRRSESRQARAGPEDCPVAPGSQRGSSAPLPARSPFALSAMPSQYFSGMLSGEFLAAFCNRVCASFVLPLRQQKDARERLHLRIVRIGLVQFVDDLLELRIVPLIEEDLRVNQLDRNALRILVRQLLVDRAARSICPVCR